MATQHVLIEDEALAEWLKWVWSGLPEAVMRQPIWPRDAAAFRWQWDRMLRLLHCADAAWTPAGLRGGGATDHFLRHRDLAGLRRRSRWQQQQTVDRYLQEGVLLLHQRTLPRHLSQLADCGAALFAPQAGPPLPLHTSNC